jgi:signal transduction histidine kinase
METITHTMDDIRALSKDLYPNQLEKYGLAAAVDALCEKVAAATGIFVSSDLQEIEPLLGREAVINCYRIIQESLNNIIKHAGATAVRITGTSSDAGLLLCIMDNGSGFDTNALERKSQTSFGLLNMEERAKMLGGKMELQSNKTGTRIYITLPG